MKKRIIEVLQRKGEMFTSEIAKELRISPTTASKYLCVLEAKDIVEKDEKKKPYIHWRLKSKKG
jgi:predicted ArsR family transcriptional regulator